MRRLGQQSGFFGGFALHTARRSSLMRHATDKSVTWVTEWRYDWRSTHTAAAVAAFNGTSGGGMTSTVTWRRRLLSEQWCGARTLYLSSESTEHGRTAVCPATTVTFTIGTSNDGSSPRTVHNTRPRLVSPDALPRSLARSRSHRPR